MSFRSLITRFVFLAVVLLIAASKPDVTLSALGMPARIQEHFDEALEIQLDRLEWNQVERSASEGDVDAVYQVGLAHLKNRMSHLTGMIEDQLKGDRLIREAAASGHSRALIKTWKLDGEQPDELLKLSQTLRQKDYDSHIFGELNGWLQWYSVQNCNSLLLTEAKLIATESARHFDGITGEGITNLFNDTAAKFERVCGSYTP